MSYEMEPIVIKREKKTLAFNCMLSTPADKDGAPLQWVGYSRFVVTIIDNTSGKVFYPRANIPESDIPRIYGKTNAAIFVKTLYDMLSIQYGTSGDSGKSAPPDPTIPVGANKGKTVLDAAKNMSADECRKQAEFYRSNLEKYSSNKAFVDAFLYAAAQKDGGVSCEAATAAPSLPQISIQLKPVTIYEQKMKFIRSVTDDKGNVLIYSIRITYSPAMTYPYEIEIGNGYAPIISTSNGAFQVEASKMINKQTANIRLNTDEFETIINKLYFCCRDFDNSMFSSQYRKAKRAAGVAAGYNEEQLAQYESQFVPAHQLKAERDGGMTLQLLEELQQMMPD